METPKLAVFLPEETQAEIYQLFVTLATEAVKEVTKAQYKPYVNQSELCQLLKCNTTLIKEWRDQGLPYFKKGNSIMFVMEEVDQFIRANLLQ